MFTKSIKRSYIFENWVLKNRDKTCSIYNITQFIKKLFKSLPKCFWSGAIIFEDEDILFNLLTYNKLEPKVYDAHNDCAYKAQTYTHGRVFEKDKVKPVEKNKVIKWQLYLSNGINICSNNSQKSVILYYPFKYRSKNYLFFKLEEHAYLSPGPKCKGAHNAITNTSNHLKSLIKRKFFEKKIKKTYTRREDCDRFNGESCNYKQKMNDDIDLYTSLIRNKETLNLNINKLKNYNKFLRTGEELFITNDVLKILLVKYFKFYKKKSVLSV